MRAYKKPGRPPCSVDGCVRPLYCRGKCLMHYNRELKGIEGGAEPLRRAFGTGSVNGDGYWVFHDSSHPLSNAQGKLLGHRAVLFDAIGAGVHPCHWCEKPLTWRGAADARINGDHLDHNKLNNDISNLVVSCLDCNTKRRVAVA